ncbi:MAG: FAD-dependent oxidoreductase [Desulfobacca sp.]|uniref:FAD-dependent oxidoreductase n=1 Tax=Desulfobacca sp. TaxID=2067990 RepID=UPI004049309D
MEMKNMKPVVILGGGIAGITAALELSKAGVAATLVEKSPFFGGKAATFACKATDACQKCGACRVEQGLRDLMAAPGVTLMAQTELVASQPNDGGWHLTLQSQPRVIDPLLCTNCGVCLEECPVPGAILSTASAENHPRYAVHPALCRYFQDQSCTRCQEVCPTQAIDLSRSGTAVELDARSIIVATGYQPASPPCRGDYTNYDLPNIITGWELEEMMKEGGRLVRPSDGRPVRHLGFIQCVGSRDQEHTYCSRVCCAYALRLARLVRHRWPECLVTLFYMDLQNVGPDPKAFEEEVRQEIELIRALPGDLTATADGSLRLRFLDEESGKGLYRVVDLLVLTVGIWPGVDNPKLAALLQLELTPDGFLKDGLEAGPESRGIFLAGTATGPQSILECIAQATQSVERVREYLETRT